MSLPLTPSMTGSPPPPSNHDRVLDFLQIHLEQGKLEPHSHDMLHRSVLMMDEISLLLFPPSHILHAAVRQRIETLADAITNIFYVFGEHIDRGLRRAKRANAELPDLDVAEEQRLENLRVWREVIEYVYLCCGCMYLDCYASR